MHTLIVYPDGTDRPGTEFHCANGFVSRVVSAVANANTPDAYLVAEILNDHAAKVDPRDPRPGVEGIFRNHNCAYCNSGAKPCRQGNPNRCEYPHARND